MKIDASNFNQYMTHLQRLTGADTEKLIRHECEKVLTRAAQLTKQAGTKKILERFTMQGNASEWEPHPVFGYKRYGPKQPAALVWSIKIGGRTYVTRKVAKEDLQMVKANLRKRREQKIKSRGLSRATFVHLGNELGLKVKSTQVAMKAVDAVPSYKKAQRATEKRTNGYLIELESEGRAVTSLGAGGRKAMGLAMKGRVGYMKQNWANDVFKSSEEIASKYGFMAEG